MEKMKEWTNKKKLIVGVVTLVCVGIVAGGATAVSVKNKEAAKIEEKQKEQKNVLDSLNKDLKAALDKDDEHYLVQGFTQEKMESLTERKDKAISIEGNEKVQSAITTVKDSFEKVQAANNRQEAVNSLYKKDDQTKAMDGTELKKDLAITDDLKKEIVMNVKDAYFVKDAKDDYDKTINDFITTAEDQLTQIDKAKAEVEKVYKDNKVVSTDEKLYDTAKAEVDKIKNEKAKKDLQAQLDQVKADIDTKAKEEADKVKQAEVAAANEASAATAAQAAATNSPDTGVATSNNATEANTTYANSGAGTNAASGNNTGGGYTPPASGGGATSGGNATTPAQPSVPAGGNSDGSLTQSQLDQAAQNAANGDPTKDPNSPWYKP